MSSQAKTSDQTIMLVKNIDTSKFVHVKQVYNDRVSWSLKYKTESGKLEDIGIQLPLLRAPFGIKNVEDPKYNPNNENMWKINLSLDTASEKYNKNGAVDKLVHFMNEIDRINREFLLKNSKEIYGSAKSAESISEFYASVISHPSEKALAKAKESGKTYSDNIRAKVQVFKDGNPGFKAFVENSNGEVEEVKLTTPDVDENGVQLKTEDGKLKYKINWEIFSKPFDCRVILKCDKMSKVGKTSTFFTWKLYVVKMIASSKSEITKDVFVQDDDEDSKQKDEIKEASSTVEEQVEEDDEVQDDED